ncbi:MAG: TlpA disulfide reductase family protein [Candidatus Acidiferrales bacterium]
MKNKLTAIATVVILGVALFVFARNLKQSSQADSGSSVTQAGVPGAQQENSIISRLTFKDLNGKVVNIEDYRGKVVWLDFWQTWCEPCKIEIPWLIEFQTKYASRGFTVIGVAGDPEGLSKVAPFLQKERFDVNGQQLAINYPIVLGTDAIADRFGVDALPTGLLISRDGHLIKTTVGLVDRDEIAKDIESQF